MRCFFFPAAGSVNAIPLVQHAFDQVEPSPMGPIYPSRHDALNKATVAAQTQNMLAFAADSAYSPFNLTGLPPPASLDLCPQQVSWQDPFEDLLAVSMGGQLPSPIMQSTRSILLRSLYPRGEPADVWVLRLREQGLLAPFTQPWIIRATQAWKATDQKLQPGRPCSINYRTAPVSSGSPRSPWARYLSDQWDQLSSELLGVGTTANHKVIEASRGKEMASGSDRVGHKAADVDIWDLIDRRLAEHQRSAGTLGTAFHSAWLDLEKTLSDVAGRAVGEIRRRLDVGMPPSGSAAPSPSSMPLTSSSDPAAGKAVCPRPRTDGLRQITRRNEHVDEHGRRHIEHDVRTLDKDGVEVARETLYEVSTGWPQKEHIVKQTPTSGQSREGAGKSQQAAAVIQERKENSGSYNSDSSRGGSGGGWFWS